MKTHGQLFYEALQRAALGAETKFRTTAWDGLEAVDVKVFERAAVDYDSEIAVRTNYNKPILGYHPPGSRRV